MGQEIERKFLLSGDGWKAGVVRSHRLQQGYLSTSAKATVRVRIFDDSRAVITLKGPVEGLSRAEFEYDIPLADAQDLLKMSAPNVVEKTRYEVPFGDHLWEVDVFEGRHAGLIIAEVEMKTEADVVLIPDWVGREVSDDGRYANASLSRSEGIPG